MLQTNSVHNLFNMRICGFGAQQVYKSFASVRHINCASALFLGKKCILDVMDECQELFIVNKSTWSLSGLVQITTFISTHKRIGRQHSILLSALCDHIQFMYMSVCHQSFSLSNKFVDKNEAHPFLRNEYTRNDTTRYYSCTFQALWLNGSETFGTCTACTHIFVVARMTFICCWFLF